MVQGKQQTIKGRLWRQGWEHCGGPGVEENNQVKQGVDNYEWSKRLRLEKKRTRAFHNWGLVFIFPVAESLIYRRILMQTSVSSF